MEMTGKVIAILPPRSGVSQRGEWKTQSFVIETQEQYPRHLCFDVFGADKITQFNIQSGETITVQFDIDARQYQDKWFNSIKAWNIVRLQPGGQIPQGAYQQAAQQAGWMGIQQPAAPTGFPTQQAPVQPKADGLPF